jgi:hypothetical protein
MELSTTLEAKCKRKGLKWREVGLELGDKIQVGFRQK